MKNISNKIISFLIVLVVLGVAAYFVYPKAKDYYDTKINTIDTEDGYKSPIYAEREVYEYYYERLTDDEKVLYKELLIATATFRDSYITKVKHATSDNIKAAFRALIYDHPEIYWIESYSLTSNNVYDLVKIKYFYTEDEANLLNDQMKVVYEPIIEEARKLPTTKEKITYVHDELIKLGTYSKAEDITGIQYQSIISLFTTGDTVCSGFTYAFKFIMDELGIKAINISDVEKLGTADAHIWNGVYVDNSWKYLDITWDNQADEDYGLKYEYFLLDREKFYETHEEQDFLPEDAEVCNEGC